MLELRDVSRTLGREPILTRASFQFTSEIPTAVLGLSAPARESFLRLLSGADKPQTGSIRLGGKDVSQARREKGRIVRIGRHGVKPSGQKAGKLAGREALERVRLGARLDVAVSELDLDQRLRLAIASAQAAKPLLILLDAPSADLALDIRERFVADLGQMLSDTGAVVVLAAGAADEALGLGGQALVLDRGRILQAAHAADLFGHPANLTVALATSHPVLNTLAMQARAGQGLLADGSTFQPPDTLRLPSDGACTLAFRPEDTTLDRRGAQCVRFIVRALGEETIAGRRFLRVHFAGADWLAPHAVATPPPGMVLNVFVDRSRLMVFDAEGRAHSVS